MQLANARLVFPDGIQSGSLFLKNGRIVRSTRARAGKKGVPAGALDLRGGYLAPGFIDLHIHGAQGRDTMEASEEAFGVISQFHLLGGTTSLALTTVTADQPSILRVLEAARPWQNRSLGGARLLGVHIEGPFLSPARAGAQDPRHLRLPQAAEWRRYLRYGSLVTQMTLAPELKGSLPLIRALRKNGSIASAGHTDAHEEQLFPALAAGLNQGTHTFNCMSTITKRGPYRLGGMIEFGLAQETILCELIADGCHVPPLLMRLLFNAKGPEGICLITDATAGAGLPVGSTFRVGGPDSTLGKVTRDTAVLIDETGLAGSTLTMMEGVRHCVELAGIALPDAVRMATLNPARQLGREAELGSLAAGHRADLVWFDDQFQVRGVWLDGDVRFLG